MNTVAAVPPSRVRALVDAPIRGDAQYVLYWMIAARRTHDNFALDHAVAYARSLGKPLVVLEPLRVGYRWAADRHHAFVMQGMADQWRRFHAAGATYLPYVEPEAGHGRGLLAAASGDACVVVTDDWPAFFGPRMLEAAARQVEVRLEAIDGAGLLPLRATSTDFPTAYAFRRNLQRTLPGHLFEFPAVDPLRGGLPGPAPALTELRARWPMATLEDLREPARLVRALPIDHVPVIVDTVGGENTGRTRMQTFARTELPHYDERRNHPDDDAGSRLSPWLHFGHVSPHGILRAIAAEHDFGPDRLGPQRSGAREGFWNLPASVEAFLDELVTWRELGLNFCTHRRDGDRFESLPAWALRTIAAHADDPRPVLYDHATLEAAHTHDALWNAAQRQLRHTGVMHNYLRMLWGKLVLTWSPRAEQAVHALVELNNRWSLDGRDPNSYSGIFWVFGRYDRAWPVRPVFGALRCMTSDSTRRKLRVRAYLERWAAPADGEPNLADRAVSPKRGRGRSRA